MRHRNEDYPDLLRVAATVAGLFGLFVVLGWPAAAVITLFAGIVLVIQSR